MEQVVPLVRQREIRADVSCNVPGRWYNSGAEEVAMRAYRKGVQDALERHGIQPEAAPATGEQRRPAP